MQLNVIADQIQIADKPIDFRKSIDGLSIHVTNELNTNPTAGVFVFYNKHRNRLKILCWHGNGFMLIYKKLGKGKFFIAADQSGEIKISQKEFDWLVAGLDWQMLSNWDNPGFEVFA